MLRVDWLLHRAAFHLRVRYRQTGDAVLSRALRTEVAQLDTKPYKELEAYRRQLAADVSTYLDLEDYGAGYAADGRRQRRVTLQALVRSSARRYRSGLRLAACVALHRPQKVLELGTNLGFSAAYLYQAGGSQLRALHTVEGSVALAAYARGWLPPPVTVHAARFEDFLRHPPTSGWDLVLLDGHHVGSATETYLIQLAPQLAPGAWVLVDDVDWSPDMMRAWQRISALHHGPRAHTWGGMGILRLP